MARTTVERASPLWLGVSLAAVAGFLVWLFLATRSVETAVTPELEEEGAAADPYSSLTLDELRANLAGPVGRTVELEPAPVGRRLGRGAFTLLLDSATSYPVLMSRDLISLNTQVYGGDRVRAYGHIFTFNDSIRGVWVDQTAVDAENAQSVPRTASFLLADSLEFTQ